MVTTHSTGMLYMPQSLKQCSRCEEFKLKSTLNFSRNTDGRDQLHTQCRECKRQLHTINRERDAKRDQQYYQNNKEKAAAVRRRYAESHREERLEYHRQYHASHAVYAKEESRKRYRNNRAQALDNARRYRQENKELISERRKSPIGRALNRVKSATRRAVEKGAGGKYTLKDVQHQYTVQGGKCFYCRCDVGEKYHVDHFIPLSRGGSNAAENIVIACPSCNLRKQNKLPDVFIAELHS